MAGLVGGWGPPLPPSIRVKHHISLTFVHFFNYGCDPDIHINYQLLEKMIEQVTQYYAALTILHL